MNGGVAVPIRSFAQTQPAQGVCPFHQAEASCPVSEAAVAFDPFEGEYQVDPAEALRWSRPVTRILQRQAWLLGRDPL